MAKAKKAAVSVKSASKKTKSKKAVAKRKAVVVRTFSAGAFYGYLVARRGQEVDLVEARRIWSWEGAASLSQVAVDGVGPNSRIAVPVTLTVTEAIEIIDATPKAQACIEGLPSWKI
jgi:hypothetical protein